MLHNMLGMKGPELKPMKKDGASDIFFDPSTAVHDAQRATLPCATALQYYLW